jgi:hypothetical protein
VDDVVVDVDDVEDVTVCGQGATWEAVLIDGNCDDEDDTDGVLVVGVVVGAAAGAVAGGAAVVELLNGDGVGAGAVGFVDVGGATWAPALIVLVSRTMQVTAPRRSHRVGMDEFDKLRIIAGDP